MKIKNSSVIFSKRFNIFIVVAIILNMHIVNAQEEFICATPDPTGPESSGVYSYSTSTDYLQNFYPHVFNVHFWGVRAPDGSSDYPLTETLALEAIAILNIEYNQYNIFFKYRGFSTFDSRPNQPLYDSDCNEITNGGGPVIDPEGFGSMDICEIGAFLLAVGEDGYYNTDTFNIYVPYEANKFGGSASNPYNVIIPSYNLINPSVIIHEIGHTFRLHHTHAAFDNDHNPCEEEPCNNGPYYDAEHVTRNESDPDYNADQYGDYVTDTAAVPPFTTEYCYYNGLPNSDCGENSPYRNYYIDPVDCTYSISSPNGDHLGFDFEIFEEDVKNYMAYTHSHCRGIGVFSPGQINKMQESITNNIGGYYDDIDTDISSLYEPYKGTYSDGSVPVGPQIPPHFQPGFDYIFKRCGPVGDYPPPLNYFDTSFNVYGGGIYTFDKHITNDLYGTIIHQNNYAVYIDQIDDNQSARCCYSVDAADADDGTIVKFNDNVFNANVTITPQDSTGINNPNLIENLDPGLYSIQKNYDGIIEETVIFKEND